MFCKKKVFLEISQNSRENTFARVSLLKKRLWHTCLPVNFAKFLRTPFLQNFSGRLLLGFFNICICNGEKCWIKVIFMPGNLIYEVNFADRYVLICHSQYIKFKLRNGILRHSFPWLLLQREISVSFHFHSCFVCANTSKILLFNLV